MAREIQYKSILIIEAEDSDHIYQESDAVTLMEHCLDTNRVLLYDRNLSDQFFDLSSRNAGNILQKFRNYQIRIALVLSTDRMTSSRFGDMLSETKRGREFGIFDNREAALNWLCLD